MSMTIIEKSIDKVFNTKDKILSSYDKHIRNKAIDMVNQRLEKENIDINMVSQLDYEVMVSDASKDIRANYNKRSAQSLLVFIGLDFLV